MNPKYTKDENGKDLLTITEKEDQVMMEWEKPLMIVVVGRPSKDATVPAHAVRKKPLEQISSWL